ncbi:MAG: thiol-disulfide oxidoreductase DCC family protein [Halalkalicoccus sp.]
MDGTSAASDHPVVLFDGLCTLCAGTVQFLIERDPEGVFRFAPLQSSVGERLLAGANLDADLDSIVLVEDGEAYAKSDAVIRIAARLGGIYRLASPLRYLPRGLRDPLYEFVAARRYEWFGRRDRCMMPTPDLESRFLARNSPEE